MGTLFQIPLIGETDSVSHLVSSGLFVSRRSSSVDVVQNNSQYIGAEKAACYAGICLQDGFWVGVTKSPTDQKIYMCNWVDGSHGETVVWSNVLADTPSTCYNITAGTPNVEYTFPYETFANYADLINALEMTEIPIAYRDTNCVHNGPNSARAGATVTVNYTFTDGYGIINPSTDIYVTNNGVVIPSSYNGGRLTFTMPSG